MSRKQNKNRNEKKFLEKVEICKGKYRKFIYKLIIEEGMIALPLYEEYYNETVLTKPAAMRFFIATEEDIQKARKELGMTPEPTPNEQKDDPGKRTLVDCLHLIE